ncbi:MAG: hypothetical protein HFJ30_03905 [Clostridia bacterium]|jgi:hypothetical protein|nr:hypothetical protein [Clostridia bacterium]
MFELDISVLEAEASEEARRLYEREFHYHNPYTRVIETGGIPTSQVEEFCQMVEEELLRKGEKIHREGKYFKIERYQAK